MAGGQGWLRETSVPLGHVPGQSISRVRGNKEGLMRRIRILGLAVFAVFAFGAVTAMSASAVEPGWFECAKNKESGKLEKGCAKEGGKGGYEIKSGVGKNKPFKGKGGPAVLHVKTWLGDNKV